MICCHFLLKCAWYTHMGAAATAQCDGRDAQTTKQHPNQLSDGWCSGGGNGAGPHFSAQTRINAPLSPSNPFQQYSGRQRGGQSACDGHGDAVNRANMVLMERRKLSKKSGLTRTTFSSLKKVITSLLLHHSVAKGYHEGMVPRILD